MRKRAHCQNQDNGRARHHVPVEGTTTHKRSPNLDDRSHAKSARRLKRPAVLTTEVGSGAQKAPSASMETALIPTISTANELISQSSQSLLWMCMTRPDCQSPVARRNPTRRWLSMIGRAGPQIGSIWRTGVWRWAGAGIIVRLLPPSSKLAGASARPFASTPASPGWDRCRQWPRAP